MPKIMIHGNAPWVPSGYGQQAALLARRLQSLGHEVIMSANFGLNGVGITWEGLPVLPAAGDGDSQHGCSLLEDHVRAYRADLVVMLGDAWYWPTQVLRDIPCPVALWMPIDCWPLGQMDHMTVAQTSGYNVMPVAMSRHGQRMLTQVNHAPFYAPHTFDPDIFHDDLPADEIEHRMDRADGFRIGICAANKDGTRKGWSEQFQAFAHFYKEHDDAQLLVHTVNTTEQGGLDLKEMAYQLGIHKAVTWSNQYAQKAGLVTPRTMATWYRSIDLLSACSWGEGFGIPALEAQACGTPAVTTDMGAQQELGAAWRVQGDPWWIGAHNAWWMRPRIENIVVAYEEAWRAWTDPDTWGRHSHNAVQFASVFSNTRQPNPWAEILQELL